jgi:hypothetical protein
MVSLLGRNEHPAEIAGWDFVPAVLARTMITAMHGAQWRWVICDRFGHAINCGITSARPCPSNVFAERPRPDAGRRSGIVELQLTIAEMDTLLAEADRHGGWAAVIRDIARQHQQGRGGDDAFTAAVRSAYRRSPTARLRRAVQIRDRVCVHPACRAPAARADQEHAPDRSRGGLTIAANLGSCGRFDHRVMHDGGWHVNKPDPPTTVWTSPLGHRYVNQAPAVMPTLPRPRPADACSEATLLRRARERLQEMNTRLNSQDLPNRDERARCGCHGHCGCHEAPIMAAMHGSVRSVTRRTRPAAPHNHDPYITDPPPF